MKLHSYFRSSAAYRVRIALNLKRLDHSIVPVHLLRDGGGQRQAAYRALNPQGLVPVLEDGPLALAQSLAILEYLDETHPQPALLPADPPGRARVRAIALAIACEIHPLNNLRVLRYLQHDLGVAEPSRTAWYHHWIRDGFDALERQLAFEWRLEAGFPAPRYCHGDSPTLADCCLVPQVFNALRFEVPVTDYPTIMRIYTHCLQLEAFQRAAPESQPDSE